MKNEDLKNSRNFFFLSLILSLSIGLKSNAQVESVVVLDIYTQGVEMTPEMAGGLLRIEIQKTDSFRVLDIHDVAEVSKEQGISLKDCYGRKCLADVGKRIGVSKMISGSVERLGRKIVISLKMLNLQNGEYERTIVQEYVDLEEELQAMMKLAVEKLLGIESDSHALMTLSFFDQPPKTPNSNISNTGPRMGVAFIGGEQGQRLSDPESDGGYDGYPVVSQFGYQIEKVYLSSGDFHAILEGLIMLSGAEQQLFTPSFILMNGFRSSRSGLEFAFGPSFSVSKLTKGYYNEGVWVREADYVGDGISKRPEMVTGIDSRGKTTLTSGFVFGLGKTFYSGHLNIPVNFFYSTNRRGYYAGLSVGFNIQKSKR